MGVEKVHKWEEVTTAEGAEQPRGVFVGPVTSGSRNEAAARYFGRLISLRQGAVLHLYCRTVAGHALPLSTGRLHPGIRPALVRIHRFAILVRAFAGPVSGRDSGVPEHGDLHIANLAGFPFCRLDMIERLSLANRLAIAAGIDEIVRKERSDRLRIARL